MEKSECGEAVKCVVERLSQILPGIGFSSSINVGFESQWHKPMPPQGLSGHIHSLWVNIDWRGRRIMIQPSVYSSVRATWVRYDKDGNFDEEVFMERLKRTEKSMKKT